MKKRHTLLWLPFRERDIKRGWRAALCCAMMLMLLAVTGVADGSSGIIRGDTEAYWMIPWTQNQAIALKEAEGRRLALCLTEADEGNQDVLLPETATMENLTLLPAWNGKPQFLVNDSGRQLTSWYVIEDGQPELFWTWLYYPCCIAKNEGLLLYGRDESAEFVSPQGDTLLIRAADWGRTLDVIWDDAGWLLLSNGWMSDLYTVRRIGLGGETEWVCEGLKLQEPVGFFTDGAGGAWLGYSRAYTGPMTLAHISAQGVQDRRVSLGGEPRVKYLYGCRVSAPGEVTLYGTSVAHSKGIYHAFALTLKSDGESKALEVRDFRERQDYGIEIQQATDGTVYVYSRDENMEAPVLVPFEGMPKAQQHGLTVSGN